MFIFIYKIIYENSIKKYSLIFKTAKTWRNLGMSYVIYLLDD